jgi:hypothetical protein
LLWLTLVVGMAAGWWIDRTKQAAKYQAEMREFGAQTRMAIQRLI